jgi:hypothetical protein
MSSNSFFECMPAIATTEHNDIVTLPATSYGDQPKFIHEQTLF